VTQPCAWVVTIGDELVRGEIVDSNKSFFSQRLLQLDIETTRHVTVGDDADAMAEVLREAVTRARIVLVSGGLGPTRDDLTTEIVARTFGRGIRRDPATLERVTFWNLTLRVDAERRAELATALQHLSVDV